MMWIVWFVLGAFGWTFAEYALHNWYGHKTRGRNDFSREHLKHHAVYEYFAPTAKKIATAVPVLTLVGAALCLAVGLSTGLSLTLGFASMYTAYEVLHRRIHTHAPWNFYGRWARRHHYFHHYGNSKMNHGVTTPLWDIVFGTYVRPDVIAVPDKHVMRWLRDASTGAVDPRYAQDYRISAAARAL
jgi:4-hydroxysphinganine ceramide fatty acyl 2-hydroxylase